MSVADALLALQALCLQPFVSERKSLTAVIVLDVVNAHAIAVFSHRTMLLHAVGNLREHFGEVNRGVLTVPDAEKQDFSVQLIDAADRTLEAVRRQGQRLRGDRGGVRAERGERERMIAASRAWQAPE